MDKGRSEHLITLVSLLLCDGLRRTPWKGNANRYAGHCYVASEALHHLIPGMRPQLIRHEGRSHWFLLDASGSVVDVTASQFHKPVPYGRAIGKGFLTKGPSKRARVLMERVLCECRVFACGCGEIQD